MMKRSRSLVWLFLGAIVLGLIVFVPSRLHRGSGLVEPPLPEAEKAPVVGKLEPRRALRTPEGMESADTVEPEGASALENLPSLPDSDSAVRDRLRGLSAKPQWQNWLANEQLVRKASSFIAQLAKGEVDRRAAGFLAPKGKFVAVETPDGRYLLDPAGYRRYNAVADVIESVNAEALTKAYRELSPLFQAAFAELGYPGHDFDATLLQAIDLLLVTPVLKGQVELIRPAVMYRFADLDIEGLHPAQKQLIRMGPRNMQKIQEKLRALRSELAPAKDE